VYDIPVAVRFIGIQANSPPGTCGCFWLKGGAADLTFPVFDRLSATVEVAGVTVDRVPASSRGLSEITLLAGPRYTIQRKPVQFSVHTLFGVVRGFNADFLVGSRRTDNTIGFAMASGGAVEIPLRRHMALRVAQIDYMQTNIANGADNRQRNVRIGAGIVFHAPSVALR
jgi:hypothetical protein